MRRRLLKIAAGATILGMMLVIAERDAWATPIVVEAVRARDAANSSPDNSLSETSGPFSPVLTAASMDIDPFLGIQGSAEAYADLGSGTLKAFASNSDANSTSTPDAIAQVRDTLWLSGTPDLANAFSFSITANIDGFVAGDLSDAFFTLQIGTPTISAVSNPHTITYGPGAGDSTNLITDTVTRSFLFGVPVASCDINGVCTSQAIDVNAVLEARIGAGAGEVNFFNTAVLSLALASGVEFTSASGAFLSGPARAAVPEPATLTLTALGLAGVVSRYRRRHFR